MQLVKLAHVDYYLHNITSYISRYQHSLLSQFGAGTLPQRGLSHSILKQVDGLTLHWKKDFVDCVLMNVLRMNSIFFVCVGFIRMKEFYCIIV